nr:meiotic recombination protein REC8 homolog [Nerophis lumbriciformis]
MFYYPVVLQRHTGCFSTIWLVATKGKKVPRREFLKVNVTRTCDDIMNYVLEQVPPPHPSLPRPRFSLYLSSQLQYGVVLVFHRQCTLLLEDIQYIWSRLLKQKRARQLDIEDQGKQALLFRDALSYLDDADGVPDPFFGVMDDGMASLNTLIKMADTHLQMASRQELTPSPLQAITASRGSITMKETELFTIPTTEFEGPDLEANLEVTLAHLDEQPDNFLEVMERQGGAPAEEEVRETTPEREQEMDAEPTQTIPELPEDTILHPPDKTLEIPPTIAQELTPVSAPAAAEVVAELEAAPLPGRKVPKRKRKRQLIFFDPETQIHWGTLKRQIDDPLIGTRAPTFLPPVSQRMKTDGELLGAPCNVLPEELLLLWKLCISITTEAEREQQRPEVPEDAAKLGVDSTSDSGLLEMSNPREVIYQSDQDGSVSTLPGIREEIDEMAEKKMESVGLLPGLEEQQGETAVLFETLLPPQADRRTVSNVFQKLLEDLTSRRRLVQQDMPYGDILITPGPNF